MSAFRVERDFLLDGNPVQLISGSIHYFRVVPPYWRHRLEMLRAMGCNTVELYIPWNFHEPKQGQFDFTGHQDVVHFIKLAEELGLYAIVRPSPYICAEWEFGGLPAWLLKEEMVIRSRDPRFLHHVAAYYDVLMPLLAPLQVTRGGNVLMMQVENEYGSYGDDKEYLAALAEMMKQRGIEVPLFTSDGPEPEMISCGTLSGLHPTCNFGSRALERVQFMADRDIAPKMCMEFWCGWFDHWGKPHMVTDPAAAARDFGDMLDHGSINVYMFHGGTTFGLMNGANDNGTLTPDVNSYDYDAPLSEEGRITEKYRLFRQEAARRTDRPLPEPPAPPSSFKAYGEAALTARMPLLDALKNQPVHQMLTPQSMEMVDQAYGYILYRTNLQHEESLRFIHLNGAADRVQVLLNGQCVATRFDRELNSAITFEPHIPVRKGDELAFLVENLGRVNYGPRLPHQRKGIHGEIFLNGHQHFGWEAISLDETLLATVVVQQAEGPSGVPTASAYTFQVDQAGDTWVDMSGFGKGTVAVNGFLLGRFWDIGPQRRLFIPAPLLKAGTNTLLVVETEGKLATPVLCDAPDLGDVQKIIT